MSTTWYNDAYPFLEVTISNSSPAVITRYKHGLSEGTVVRFTTTGTLPTGLSLNTDYYVISSGLALNSFKVSLTEDGTAVNTSSNGSGTHSIVVDSLNKSASFTLSSTSDIINLIKDIPFHIEEYSEVTRWVDSAFIKNVSPLFLDDIVQGFTPSIEIILDKIPLYSSNYLDEGIIRDPSEINVPTLMRNEFWKTFFRDALGTEYNNLIYTTYNTLKFPWINEISLLYDDIFYTFQENFGDNIYFESTSDNETYSQQKLDGIFSLLDYQPFYHNLLDNWLESEEAAGFISSTDLLTQEKVYKAQDIKNELLRRKIAGTSAFFNMIFSCIGRRGSLYPTVPILSTYQEVVLFKDDRLFRTLFLPYITIEPFTPGLQPDIYTIDPIAMLEGEVPTNLTRQLWYSSEGFTSAEWVNNPDQFLRHTADSFNKYPIDWSNLDGITDPGMMKQIYLKLDTNKPQTDPARRWTLDDESESSYTGIVTLDTTFPLVYPLRTTSSFLDLQCDTISYHKSDYEIFLAQNYKFYRDYFAYGNGPTLSDIPWIDYIEKVSNSKKRASEFVYPGVQLSVLSDKPRNIIFERIAAYTYGEDDCLENGKINISLANKETFVAGQTRYVLLWNVLIEYDKDSMEVHRQTKNLISVVYLKRDKADFGTDTFTNGTYDKEIFEDSVGILPLKYNEFSNGMGTEKIRSLTINPVGSTETTYEYVDNYIVDSGFTQVKFYFSDTFNKTIAYNSFVNLSPSNIRFSNFFSNYPSTSPRQFITWGIERDSGYTWSQPLSVVPLSYVENLSNWHAEWDGLLFHINPFLNANSFAISPLNEKTMDLNANPNEYIARVYSPSEESPPEELTEVNEYTALRQLNLTHNFDRYVNITGGNSYHYPQGIYFRQVRPLGITEETEQYQIWGDNRFEDILNDWSLRDKTRSAWYFDYFASNDPGIQCLRFTPGTAFDSNTCITDSYYELALRDTSAVDPLWAFNTYKEGLSIFIDAGLSLRYSNDDKKQYFISRALKDGNFSDSFEAYLDPTTGLHFNIFIEGKSTLTKFEVSALAVNNTLVDSLISSLSLYSSGAIPERHRFGFTYKFSDRLLPGINGLLETYATIEIRIYLDGVALNLNGTSAVGKYYVMAYDSGTSTYDLYETDETFNVDGITPTNIDAAYADYDDGTPYLGTLFVYDGVNTVPNITFGSSSNHDFPLCGNIYDIRIYGTAFTNEENRLLSLMSNYEYFTYSSGAIKSLWHFEKEAIIKKFDFNELSNITHVRAFGRPVHRSILLDMNHSKEYDEADYLYDANWEDPLTDIDIHVNGTEELKDDLLKQYLSNVHEVLSSETIDFSKVTLMNKGISMNSEITSSYPADEYNFDIVNTSLYPLVYNKISCVTSLAFVDTESNDALNSNYKAYTIPDGDGIAYRPIGAHTADMPIVPEDNTLEYYLKLQPRFKILDTSYASSPFARSTNIEVYWDTVLEDFAIRHSDKYLNNQAKDATKNYIVFPYYIPEQAAVNENSPLACSGFSTSSLIFGNDIFSLLNVENYYAEHRVPFAFGSVNSETLYEVAERVTAIRTLKEGEYFFTVKYPLQIVPLDDREGLSKFPFYYLTFRFKLSVVGIPTLPAEEVKAYFNSNNQLLNSLSEPKDKRRFKYRNMIMNLYAMKCTGNTVGTETFSWDLVASNDTRPSENHNFGEGGDYENITLLDSTAYNENKLVLKKAVNGYFTKSYTSPFFVSDPNSLGSFTTERINIPYSSIEENLNFIDTTNPWSGIKLLVGKTYKVVMDFSGNMTELSYNPVATATVDLTELRNNSDVLGYFKTSIDYVKDNTLREFMYDDTVDWASSVKSIPTALLAATGFETTDGGWVAKSFVGTLALGDPYSTSTELNGLLDKLVTSAGVSQVPYNELFYYVYKQPVLVDDSIQPIKPIPPALMRDTGDSLEEKTVIMETPLIKIAGEEEKKPVIRGGARGLFVGLDTDSENPFVARAKPPKQIPTNRVPIITKNDTITKKPQQLKRTPVRKGIQSND